jgi:hypothetical protein
MGLALKDIGAITARNKNLNPVNTLKNPQQDVVTDLSENHQVRKI